MTKSTRKYCGPNLIAKTLAVTKKCYDEASTEVVEQFKIDNGNISLTEELLFALRAYQHKRVDSWWLETMMMTEEQLHNIKLETDNKYIQKLRVLSSKQIEDILWVHEKGHVVRAQRTVEALLAELAQRSLLQS